jgi:hypothetical protein
MELKQKSTILKQLSFIDKKCFKIVDFCFNYAPTKGEVARVK